MIPIHHQKTASLYPTMDTKPLKEAHTVYHDGTQKPAGTLECLRCGATERLDLPMRIDEAVETARRFEKEHEACTEHTDA